jgi:CRISPR/Cas system endoribonuclease Cas6 (RAMP superfamily)
VLHRWPDPREVEAEWEALERIAASRWSARQGEDVRLDGWMGMARFGAGIEAFSDLLEALPILGLGRSTSAGFGWVEVSWR